MILKKFIKISLAREETRGGGSGMRITRDENPVLADKNRIRGSVTQSLLHEYFR